MRNYALLAVAFGALLGAACTNNYDAFLEQAGGADAASSSATDAATSASDAPSTATTTTGSSASSASSSDALASTSTGAGEGGQGGQGGNGPAGTGGLDPDAFPGAEPCSITMALDEIILDLGNNDDALPDGWQYAEDGSVRSDVTDEGFQIEFTQDGFSRANLYIYLADTQPFDECSLTTSVRALESADDSTRPVAFLGLFNNESYLARVQVAQGDPWEHNVTLGDGNETENRTEPQGRRDRPPTGIRIREHGESLSFDVRVGAGSWEELVTIPKSDLNADIEGIAFGAERLSPESNNSDAKVLLGPLNAD